MKRIRLGHHYYYAVAPEELTSGNLRGKNVVIEGIVEDKPLVEFLPMELPSWRTTFKIHGIRIDFAGSPCIGKGERVRVYGRFLGDAIIATAVETDKAIFTTEE
ncbi:GTP-binding protein [Thermococcus sp.]|uniref:GTP-binding protein n=1 Tax=Thermococcus sp. TaxID=35749 RepID=UPI00260E70D4|nr:GTP-binding protein [Thermococcus sp.]